MLSLVPWSNPACATGVVDGTQERHSDQSYSPLRIQRARVGRLPDFTAQSRTGAVPVELNEDDAHLWVTSRVHRRNVFRLEARSPRLSTGALPNRLNEEHVVIIGRHQPQDERHDDRVHPTGNEDLVPRVVGEPGDRKKAK